MQKRDAAEMMKGGGVRGPDVGAGKRQPARETDSLKPYLQAQGIGTPWAGLGGWYTATSPGVCTANSSTQPTALDSRHPAPPQDYDEGNDSLYSVPPLRQRQRYSAPPYDRQHGP